MTLVEYLTLASVLTGAVVSSAALVGATRAMYRKTVGRRRVLATQVAMLAPVMQLDYYVHVLGVPQSRTKQSDDSVHALWATPDAYVFVQTGSDGSVKALSVTTRTRRFRPVFFRGHTISAHGDSIEVKLGKTRFVDLPHHPNWVRGNLGARRIHYEEGYSFGNPGNYQQFIYSLSDAGRVARGGWSVIDLVRDRPGISIGALNSFEEEGAVYMSDPAVVRARSAAPINTVTVTAPHFELDPDSVLLGFGPDADFVRVIPDSNWAARFGRYRRSLAARTKRGIARQAARLRTTLGRK